MIISKRQLEDRVIEFMAEDRRLNPDLTMEELAKRATARLREDPESLESVLYHYETALLVQAQTKARNDGTLPINSDEPHD